MKKKRIPKLLKAILIEYVVAIIITVLMLLYQNNFGLYGIINGMQVSGALLFAAGWFVFINHHGIFDIVTYGVQAFFRNLRGRTMEKTLFDARMERKKMPAYLFASLWINGLIIIGISYILYYFVYI